MAAVAVSSSVTAAAQSAKWSKAANSYVKYFQPSGVVVGRYLLNCLKLQYQPQPQPQHDDSDSGGDTDGLKVLEAGCGAGALAKDLLLLDGLSVSELVVTDIADGMLEKAKTTLLGIGKESLSSSENVTAAAAVAAAEAITTTLLTVNDVKVCLKKDDFTNFQSISDGYFDRYYANLCLCYADDPDVVLKETCRVLKTKGLAGFTVWGRSDDSPLMTIVPTVLKDMKLVSDDEEEKKKRSSFHLGEDDVALRERFFKAGFSKCTVIHYPAAMECFDPGSYVELIIDGAPSTKAQIESFSKDDQGKVRKEVYDRAAIILNQGLPMSLDIVIAVAQK